MLDSAQHLLRDQMETVSLRFLHAETYFRVTTGDESTFWTFSQNCFGEVACLLWCHLFNSWNNDPVHHKKLFGDDNLVTLSPSFSTAAVRQRLLRAASLDEIGYDKYRTAVTDFRNEFVAHRDYQRVTITFPDLKIASAMIQELRLVLEETVRAEYHLCPDDSKLCELIEYYDAHKNADVISKCEREVQCVVAAVRS
jgi:hypothetical protein